MIFEAQLQNKDFKAAVLNQLEEMSNKNTYEFKNLKSKKNFVKIFRKNSTHWRTYA